MELGDNAPSERQFSPEKLYRAALLRNRFADTILKAREKTLDQMEKTVEINESSVFLKDLEILRTAPGEHLPSSVGETSPDHSPEGISGFKLGGSNPLEQLGLYMKVDDEEDEEVEPNSATANDAEEGEID
ncbi:hypothetical protein BHE74_00045566 [Ensete ventricosum]|uniref:Uncharacterized protein n=1 Tax=Ensete ventricosum TaxID=4639 RepID=A0A426YZY5_ENSVE|nr:hypothetical protein B296_00041406 [Ensete ventricosum]RWV87513.1 hypothetical protein GW17_00050481 [Ensete ventricosum]RWW48359.1 hypothetical protein BHE74_00045566 [Ensete ventricosum]RZS17069.1 hypothetical protein BHM03_00049175 [Ensete ventricosum]